LLHGFVCNSCFLFGLLRSTFCGIISEHFFLPWFALDVGLVSWR
jgi:hypothetical protein